MSIFDDFGNLTPVANLVFDVSHPTISPIGGSCTIDDDCVQTRESATSPFSGKPHAELQDLQRASGAGAAGARSPSAPIAPPTRCVDRVSDVQLPTFVLLRRRPMSKRDATIRVRRRTRWCAVVSRLPVPTATDVNQVRGRRTSPARFHSPTNGCCS